MKTAISFQGVRLKCDPAALLAQYDAIEKIKRPVFMLYCKTCLAVCTIGIDCECCASIGLYFGGKRIRHTNPHGRIPIDVAITKLTLKAKAD